MKIQPKLLLFFVVVLFFSCDDKRFFDEYKSVQNSWHKDSIVTFDVANFDTSKKYDLFINLRDNADYQYNNIFLIVSVLQPNKQVKVDTLEYEMANPDGSLLGNGFSDVKENKLVYKLNESFKLKGNYKIKIQQAMRETGKIEGDLKLKGISEVGLRIEKKD